MAKATRHLEPAPAAAVRPPALHHVVQEAAEGPHRAPPGQGGRLPDVPRRVPGAGDRPGPRKVYERNGIECASNDGPAAAARRASTAATSRRSPSRRREREGAGRVGAGRQRHRGAPADLRLRPEEGLPRLRRRPRRRARGRAHLRRRRVPHEGPQGRGHQPRHRVPRRRARDDHVPHAVPPPGPEHRPQEPRPDEAHRRPDPARAAVLGHRRHVGPAGGELRAVAAAGAQARRRDRAGRRRGRGRRLPPRQRRHHRADRAASRCTRSRCSPAPTASPRRR